MHRIPSPYKLTERLKNSTVYTSSRYEIQQSIQVLDMKFNSLH